MGAVQTGRAFRCAKPSVSKGLKEMFPSVLLRKKKMSFKQNLTADVSTFSASDIICLWGKNASFVATYFGWTLWRKK